MNKLMKNWLVFITILQKVIFQFYHCSQFCKTENFQNFVMFIAKTLKLHNEFCQFTHQFLTIAKFCFNCSSEPRRNSVFSICPPCLLNLVQVVGGGLCGGGGVEIETDSLLCQRQLQVTTQATVATESSTVYVSGLYSQSVVEEVVSELRVSSVKRVVSLLHLLLGIFASMAAQTN